MGPAMPHRPRRFARLPHFLALLTVPLALAACGEGHDPAALEAWYDEVETVQVREALAPDDAFASARRMRAAGFVYEDGRWERRADLTASPAAVRLPQGAMRHVDAVSVLSIDRHNGALPYLYATLRSVFAELPADAAINVFVGNDDLDYVAPETLDAMVFAGASERVNVVEGAPRDVAFMRGAGFTVWERSSWNYARMLRAYTGSGYHVTLEDDVLLSRGSLRVLDALLATSQPHVLSLYNRRCTSVPNFEPARREGPQLASARRDQVKGRFWGTQGVAFRAEEGLAAGRYLQAYLGEQPFDLLLDRFMRERQRELGYAYPSMVQHMGVQTTGLGYHHQSDCFVEAYPEPGGG